MQIIKYSTIFIWSLLLTAMVLGIIRLQPFIRRKKEKDLNLSEGIYTAAMLIAAALIMSQALQSIGLIFDVIQKLFPKEFWSTFFEKASVISVSSLLLYWLIVIAARWLSVILAGPRQPLIELDADNRGYSFVRAGLLLSLTILLMAFCGAVFQLMIPDIDIPLYR